MNLKSGESERMNPFDLMRYLACKGTRGSTVEDYPVVWSRTYTFKDRLPPFMTGSEAGTEDRINLNPRAGRVGVREIRHVGNLIWLFQNHTFWGKKLRPLRVSGAKADFSWRNRFINFLVHGKWMSEDPKWAEGNSNRKSWKWMPVNEYWASRLFASLQTTESLMNQFIMAFPDFAWSWDFFDGCAFHNLVELLRTEAGKTSPMSDGDYNNLAYVRLKKIRKLIKFAVHTNANFTDVYEHLGYSFTWMRMFLPRLEGRSDRASLYSGLLLCQVRGASLPPFEMGRRSVLEWERTVTTGCPPLSPSTALLLSSTVLEIHREIDKSLLPQKLSLAARMTINATSALGVSRDELGKVEAVSRILSEGREVPVYDLETGEETSLRMTWDGENTGTYLFHYSVEFCVTSPEAASEIQTFAVNEQSKSRIVSKSHVCVTIMLGILATMCSEWLALVPTSKSGMTASNHLWQLYKRMDQSNPASEFMWRAISTDKHGLDEEHADVFALSADMRTATDFGCWNRGRILLGTLAIKCLGLGTWYTGLCLRFLCGPRIVHLERSSMGLDGVVKTEPAITTTKRGWLMGDPGTKVLLHLVNLVARRVGQKMASELSVASDVSSLAS